MRYRAYPNVQNLFGELGIDDRLQVSTGIIALHGHVMHLTLVLRAQLPADDIVIAACAVERAQHDLCLA